jgi:PAS domain S-box-containing protein
MALVPADRYSSASTLVDEIEKWLASDFRRLQEAHWALKKVEEALRMSEELYRELIEGALDGIVGVDSTGRITLLNPAAERMFGHSVSEAVGKDLALLIPAPLPDPATRPLDRLTSLVGKTVELAGRRKSGAEFPLELSVSGVQRGGQELFIVVVRDQTEQKRMQLQLAQAEKLASVGLLSAGIGHEIGKPLSYASEKLAVVDHTLSSLLALLTLYEEAAPLIATAAPALAERIATRTSEIDWSHMRNELPETVARSRKGVQRAVDIVSTLRGLVRTSPPKMEEVAIPELLEGSLERLHGRLRRSRIEVVADHGPVPPLVCVRSQLSQVILHLLINAVQAIEATGRPEGGRIVFRTRCEADMVEMCVIDDGCGIEPEYIGRLFDSFFTTKGGSEGTGLGLAICHNIVTGHGGRIDLASEPGGGSCFRVVLPRKRF